MGVRLAVRPAQRRSSRSPKLAVYRRLAAAYQTASRHRRPRDHGGLPRPRPRCQSGRQTESVGESASAEHASSYRRRPSRKRARSPGGAINLATSHGHNGLHGQAFYLNRQGLWGAQNPFTQWVQQTAPANGVDTAQFTAEPYTPPNNRQTFGFGVGSQIKRDKIFWFAALDGLRSNDPAVATVRHPEEFFAQPTLDNLTMLAARLNSGGGSGGQQALALCGPGVAAGPWRSWKMPPQPIPAGLTRWPVCLGRCRAVRASGRVLAALTGRPSASI